MKKKVNYQSSEVFDIKNQIAKKVPKAKEIDVRIERADSGKYETLIRLHIPPKKRLFAVKRDESVRLALEKSKQAIFRQLDKVKNKKIGRRILEFSA